MYGSRNRHAISRKERDYATLLANSWLCHCSTVISCLKLVILVLLKRKSIKIKGNIFATTSPNNQPVAKTIMFM